MYAVDLHFVEAGEGAAVGAHALVRHSVQIVIKISIGHAQYHNNCRATCTFSILLLQELFGEDIMVEYQYHHRNYVSTYLTSCLLGNEPCCFANAFILMSLGLYLSLDLIISIGV